MKPAATDTKENVPSAQQKKQRGVLLVDDKKFAVSLTWLTADLDLGGAKLIKQRAGKLRADYTCVRNTIAGQHGFGFLSLGHRMNMPAAAAVAADILVGDWHGVFKGDNGWWYVAVRSDNISPDGDRFFFSEEEAYTHFMEQVNAQSWPRSYAPETWNIEDAVPAIPLERLLDDLTQAPILKATNADAIFGGRKRRNFVFFIGILAFVFLFTAAVLPGLASKAREKRATTVQPVIVAPAVIKPPPKVVTKQTTGFAGTLSLPKPSNVVQLCAQGFSKIIEPLPGWELNSATCNAGVGNQIVVDAVWKRKVGSLELIKQYLAAFPVSVAVNYDGDATVTVSFRLGDLNKLSKTLNVLKRGEQISVLYDRFGGIGRLELSDVIPPPPQQQRLGNPLASAEEPPPQLPPYLKMVLLTRTPPQVLASYFDVPGLKLQNITWSIQKKAWTYTAEILFDSPAFHAYYGAQTNAQ
jgi:hypothetical protein